MWNSQLNTGLISKILAYLYTADDIKLNIVLL